MHGDSCRNLALKFNREHGLITIPRKTDTSNQVTDSLLSATFIDGKFNAGPSPFVSRKTYEQSNSALKVIFLGRGISGGGGHSVIAVSMCDQVNGEKDTV